jgi:hypothetical protein
MNFNVNAIQSSYNDVWFYDLMIIVYSFILYVWTKYVNT